MPAGEPGQRPAEALRQRGLRARKRLGQNFLRDTTFVRRILDAGDIGASDVVLEIGAGTGVLTGALADRAGRVVAVELDDALYDLLVEEFASRANVEIWHGNALDFDPCAHFSASYKLVGNIPYYVTGPIVRHFLETPCPPDVMVLMVQKEVVERMVAAPGNLSLLGVSVQYYAEPSIVTRVPAGAFYPPPRVESAIVRLVPRGGSSPELRPAFFEVARAGFGTRRKQLANSLAHGLKLSRPDVQRLLEAAGIDPSRRAETLSIADWESLARVKRAMHEDRGS